MDYIIVNINKRMQRKKRECIYEYLKNWIIFQEYE